jgi:hypothetical protein
MKKEMEGGGGDPLDLMKFGLDRERLQLDRDKFAQGTREGPKFYGNVQWADRTPDDGEDNPVPYQIGSDGQVSWIDLQGANPLPPVKNVNTGTEYVVQGPGGAQVAPPIAIDNAGKATAEVVGKDAGAAKVGLPDFELQVQQATDLIDSITGNTALGNATGVLQSKLPTVSQDTANVEADVEQLKSQIFPMAIKALVGLGAMSNMEGDAMARSIASLDLSRDDKAFKSELDRISGVLKEKLAIARTKAGVAAPAPQGGGDVPAAAAKAGIDAETWQALDEDDREFWRSMK